MISSRVASIRAYRAVPAIAVAALLAAVCPSPSNAATAFVARGSAEQVYVTGLAPGEPMRLLASGGRLIATQRADSLGGLMFRNVTPGSGYRVRVRRAARRVARR